MVSWHGYVQWLKTIRTPGLDQVWFLVAISCLESQAPLEETTQPSNIVDIDREGELI